MTTLLQRSFELQNELVDGRLIDTFPGRVDIVDQLLDGVDRTHVRDEFIKVCPDLLDRVESWSVSRPVRNEFDTLSSDVVGAHLGSVHAGTIMHVDLLPFTAVFDDTSVQAATKVGDLSLSVALVSFRILDGSIEDNEF